MKMSIRSSHNCRISEVPLLEVYLYLYFSGIMISSNNVVLLTLSVVEDFTRLIVRFTESNLGSAAILELLIVPTPLANIDLVLSSEFVARSFI